MADRTGPQEPAARRLLHEHDEIRVQGWDETCDRARRRANSWPTTSLVRRDGPPRDPGKPIYVWSDMFDPYHNAPKTGRYYLVKGDGPWYGSWEGLDKDVVSSTGTPTPAKRIAFAEALRRASATRRSWPATTTAPWEPSAPGSRMAARCRGSAG